MATQDNQHRQATLRGFAAAGMVVACWSGFNIVSRMGGRSVLTPFDLAALRFGISALILLPVFLRNPTAISWPRLLILGFSAASATASPYKVAFATV